MTALTLEKVATGSPETKINQGIPQNALLNRLSSPQNTPRYRHVLTGCFSVCVHDQNYKTAKLELAILEAMIEHRLGKPVSKPKYTKRPYGLELEIEFKCIPWRVLHRLESDAFDIANPTKPAIARITVGMIYQFYRIPVGVAS